MEDYSNYMIARENGIDVEIILQWTGKREEKFYLFSNGGENENGGTPTTGIKTALTNFFKKKLKGEAAPDILRKGLVYVCSVNLKNPIYDGQTKSKITNPELRGLCHRTKFFFGKSNQWYHAQTQNRINLIGNCIAECCLVIDCSNSQIIQFCLNQPHGCNTPSDKRDQNTYRGCSTVQNPC